MKNLLIDSLLKDLQESWDYTTEELTDIKSKMLEYAGAAVMDSSVRKEVLSESEKSFKEKEEDHLCVISKEVLKCKF